MKHVNRYIANRLLVDTESQPTPQELSSDALVSLENHWRSVFQSRHTVAGARAEPMPRDRIRRAMRLLMPCPLRSQAVR